MSYRNIVVHVDHSARCPERIRVATQIALAEEAHLIGVAPTGLVLLGPDSEIAALGVYYDQTLHRLRERCNEANAAFEAQVKNVGLRSWEHRVADDEHGYAIALHGRYADLIVIGQSDANDPAMGPRMDFAEHVFLNSGRPTLIVPYAGTFDPVGTNVLIAWNASREGARAVTDALPFLKRAKHVRVLVLNGEASFEGHGAEPGADIGLYLSRHGVRVEVVQDNTPLAIGDALLSRAADYDCNLLVMGGYGHSKFREFLLGGVTRTVLECMTVPVLMSH